METIIKSAFGKWIVLLLTVILIWLGWPLGAYFKVALPLTTVAEDAQWPFIVHTFLAFGWESVVAIGLMLFINGSLRPFGLNRLNLLGYSVLGMVSIIPVVASICGLLTPPLRGESFMSGAVVGATIGMCVSFFMVLLCLLAEIEDLD